MPNNKRLIDKLKNKLENYKQVSLIRNLSTALVGEVGAAFLSFLFTTLVILTQGNNNYGIFVVVNAFAVTATRLSSFQTWQGVIKFGAQAIHDEDYLYLQSVIKSSFSLDLISTSVGFIAVLLLGPAIGSLLGWEPELVLYARWMSLALIINLNSTATGLFRVFDQFSEISFYRIFSNALKVVIYLLLYSQFDLGVMAIVVAWVSGDLVGVTCLNIRLFLKIRRREDISVRGIIKTPINLSSKSFFNFSFWANLTTIIDIPSKEFDAFILSKISYDAVAVFKVFKQVGQVLDKLVDPLKQAVLPEFSEYIADSKEEKSYKLMKSISKKSLKLVVPAVLLLGSFSLIFLYALFDPIYVKYWYVLLAYLLARGLALSASSIHPLFIALNYVKYNSLFSLIANVSYIVIALFLIQYIGIMGVVVALFAEYIIMIGMKSLVLKRRFE